MSTAAIPANPAQALSLMETLAAVVADADAAEMPAGELAAHLAAAERVSGVLAAAQGKLLAAFDHKDGHLEDGQKTPRTWIVNVLRATKGHAVQYRALQRLARDHQVLRAGLRGKAVTTSLALQLAQWTRKIPGEFRTGTEEILIAAALAGADQRALAQICQEIRSRTAPPDPDGPDPRLDRGLSLDTTFDGAGVLRGDLWTRPQR